MTFGLRSKFKIKEQLLIMIIPFIIIPIVLILSVRVYFYNIIKTNKTDLNVSMINQIIIMINDKHDDSNSSQKDFSEFERTSLFEEGLVYILENNNILYSNLESKNVEQKLDFDKMYLLNNEQLKKILNAKLTASKEYKIQKGCLIFDIKIKNKKYQGYMLNTEFLVNNISRIKFLFFYPDSKFVDPIYPLIFFILFISLIIFIIVATIFNKFSKVFLYPLNNLGYATKKASQGYLNFDFISESTDEMGQLYKNFTEMMKFNKSVLVDIANSSSNLYGYQGTFEDSIKSFYEKLKNQNIAIEENSKLIKDFDESMDKMIQHINNVKGIVDQAQNQSNDSTDLINEMINNINTIAETGQQINFIAELLNKISEKTRLLSVNSAIEASRAGDVGKGFGVVATEIRKLAVLAKDSAKEIAELVKVNDSRIISGINKTTEVLNSLRIINSSINMINQIMDQINKTTQEGKKNSRSIISADSNFIDITKENIKSLDSIDRAKNYFKIDLEKIKNAIKKIIFDVREKVVIRDVKLYKEEEKVEYRRPSNIKNILGEKKNKKELKSLRSLKKVRERKRSKLDSVRAVTLYKPKKSILDKFKK